MQIPKVCNKILVIKNLLQMKMEFILKQNQCLDVPIEETHAKEVLEVENLKKALQHFKLKNVHLNDFNDKLIQANQRLREYLE